MSGPFCGACGRTRPLHPQTECETFIDAIPRDHLAIVARHLACAADELRSMTPKSELQKADVNFYSEDIERLSKRIRFDFEVSSAVEGLVKR